MTKKPDGETPAEVDAINLDPPPPPCPHPEHRLGTHGRLRKHERVCLNCGETVIVEKSRPSVKFRTRSRT